MSDYIDISTDNHIHTKYCHHAIGEMEQYVQAAIDKKLSKIIFLEHMEAGVNYFEVTWLTENDFDNYFTEGKRLQQKYKFQIHIGLGVEVGYSPSNREELLTRLKKREWDQVGISYHFSKHQKFIYDLNLVSRKQPNIDHIDTAGRDEVLSDYFLTLKEAVKCIPGTMLCHLDAALRHQQDLKFTPTHIQLIDDLLIEVKKKGMALEVNTSGFAMRDEPFPKKQLIKKALDLGIKLVASSDAHKPEDVGRYFDRLPAYIDSARQL